MVGKLTAEYSNGSLIVTYRVTETSSVTDIPYTLLETHLYAGNDLYPLKDCSYTVAPGQYGYQKNHDDISEYIYEISGLSGPIYFIAHAVVNGFQTGKD